MRASRILVSENCHKSDKSSEKHVALLISLAYDSGLSQDTAVVVEGGGVSGSKIQDTQGTVTQGSHA